MLKDIFSVLFNWFFNLLMNQPIVQKARSRAIQLYQKIIISTYQFNTKHIFWLIQISVASEVC